MTDVITEPKRVYVTCSGPGGKPQRPLVEIEPGTTPADLLDQLTFSPEEYDLLIKNGPLLDSDADLYNAIGPTTELQVVPKMEQGVQGASSEAPSFFRFLRRVRHPAPLRVGHTTRPLWEERGWQELAPGVFRGTYLTPFRAFAGTVRQQGTRVMVYIDARPAEVDHHPHGNCLWQHGKEFELHYKRPPTSVDAAIIDMERYLTTSFRRARAARRTS